MRKALLATNLLFMVILTSGCVFFHQKVNLQPEVNIAEINYGNGIEVLVKVADERPEKVIGHKGGVFTTNGETITTDRDVEKIVFESIMQGLHKQGFNPIANVEDSHRMLKVEIRNIAYRTSHGFVTGAIHTAASIKAVATNNGKTYEKMYVVENEKRSFFGPSDDETEELINTALSQTLEKLLQDQDLLVFLQNKTATNISFNKTPEKAPVVAQPAEATLVKDNTPLKKCSKCGREIERNETICITTTGVVCPECFEKLKKQP